MTRTIVTDLHTDYPLFLGDIAVNGYTSDQGVSEGMILVAYRNTGTTNAYSFKYFQRSSTNLAAAASTTVTYGTGTNEITPHFEKLSQL